MPVRVIAEDATEQRGWPSGERLRPSYNAVARLRRGDNGEVVLVAGGRRAVLPSQQLEDQTDTELPSWCEDEDMSDGPQATNSEDTDSEMEQQVPGQIQPCVIFREGMVYRGRQRVCQSRQRNAAEEWGVSVTIQEINLGQGYCSGTMKADHIVQTDHPVTTHWQGEIIDDINHSLVTCKWGASYSNDMCHWRKFKAFAPLNKKVMKRNGRCNTLHEQPVIFMRWKELFFLSSSTEGCNLTIAGFYYICLCRKTGNIEGYYFDTKSMPYQKLELEPIKRCSYYTNRKFV